MDVLYVGSVLITAAVALAAGFVGAMALVVRPWDADTRRSHWLPLSTPYPVFCAASWVYGLAEAVAAMKPAPMRIAELANNYISSQVLYSIVSLGVPDALLGGPRTAAEVALAVGPASTNLDWLDRLLSAAAVMGMLKRRKIPLAEAHRRAAGAAAASARITAKPAPAADATAHRNQDTTKQQQLTKAAEAAATDAAASGDTVWEYSLNALSAALTSQSPVSMAAFVGMCEDDYLPFGQLAEGIRSGTIPYKLHTGGQGFWEWSGDDATRATRFDLAMVAVNHYGGSAVVNTYPAWGAYDCVVDVAGGVGGFMAALMARNPGLRQGVVFDLPSNIDRAKEIWSRRHPELLPKVQLVAGDMFDASTIPTPPQGSSSTAYVLRNILHDWPDAECISILKAIRGSLGKVAPGADSSSSSSSSSSVRLLIVEVTTDDERLPCHLPHRHGSDLVMMVSFGDGKERSRQQFRRLFEASGWRLTRLTPTSGVFMVIEAEPV